MVVSIVVVIVKCFLFTEIIELAGAATLKVRGTDLVILLLTNLLTNPPTSYGVTLYQLHFGPIPWFLMLLIELFVVVLEGYIYKKAMNYRAMNTFLLSLILNCLSFFLYLCV